MEKKENPKFKKLHKLAQDWAVATMDPDIKDMAHELMAAFAFTKTPQLARTIASMAKDPKMKDDIISRVTPFIGWQGEPGFKPVEKPQASMGMGMAMPEVEPAPAKESAPTETAMPASMAPQPAIKNAPQAQPFKPGISAPVQAEAPVEEGAPQSLGMRYDESDLYSK